MPETPDERRKRWEARGVVYDDQATPDNEAARAPEPERERERGATHRWLRDLGGPDHLDARWTRGVRGWLTVRDPFTLEYHHVPTKYAQGASLPEGQAPVPASWVRRAMEKLPPKPKLPPIEDDGGPL